MGSIPAGGARKSLIFKGFLIFLCVKQTSLVHTLTKSNRCHFCPKTPFLRRSPANKISRIIAFFTPLLINLLIEAALFHHRLANGKRRTTQVHSFLFSLNASKFYLLSYSDLIYKESEHSMNCHVPTVFFYCFTDF